MESEENQRDGQLKNEHLSKLRRRAINELAIGFVILLWGSLLTLKQVGIISKNISMWPFPLTAFGIMLVGAGIYRLNKSTRGLQWWDNSSSKTTRLNA